MNYNINMAITITICYVSVLLCWSLWNISIKALYFYLSNNLSRFWFSLFVYFYVVVRGPNIKKGGYGNTLTSSTLSYLCAFPNTWTGFLMPNIVVLFCVQLSEVRWLFVLLLLVQGLVKANHYIPDTLHVKTAITIWYHTH
jgi:hypothetical protein